MFFKKDKSVAKALLDEYGKYGFDLLKLDHVHFNKYRELALECAKNNLKPEECFALYDSMVKENEEEKKIIDERYREMRLEINLILNACSQDMLVYLAGLTDNPKFFELIKDNIISKNNFINTYNNLYVESGFIYEAVYAMSDKAKKEFLEVVETDKPLYFITGKDIIELSNLSPYVKKVLCMSPKKLDEEYKKFCKKHNIKNDKEFQIYRDSFLNVDKLRNAEIKQEEINKLLDEEDSSYINETFKKLNKVSFVVKGFKLD